MEISEILQAIQEAGPEDMSDLVNTLSRRYRQLYPDWDILYIACPKNNPEEKRVILDYIVRYFEKIGKDFRPYSQLPRHPSMVGWDHAPPLRSQPPENPTSMGRFSRIAPIFPED